MASSTVGSGISSISMSMGNSSDTRRKISLFENSEREKSEREERDRKRAIFARKLSKFGQSFEQQTADGGGSRELVCSKVKLFSEATGSEERRRESERRKSEFQQKRSTFSGDHSVEVSNKISTRKVSEKVLAFAGSGFERGQLEADRVRRRQEEEERLRLEAFKAKRGVYSN